jgi:hypothetical protein
MQLALLASTPNSTYQKPGFGRSWTRNSIQEAKLDSNGGALRMSNDTAWAEARALTGLCTQPKIAA